MIKIDKFTFDPKKIKQKLQSGEYFRDARIWYNELYHRPIGERSFFIVITLLSAITIWLSVHVYLSMFPLKPVIPYIILSENIVDEYPVISPLRQAPSEDLNISIARFLIANYVQMRENYQYDVQKMEWSFNRVRSTSTEQEFAKYQHVVNPQNPASPFNKYGRDARREIAISNITLDLESKPSSAQVHFTSKVIRNKQVQINNWVANITFSFPKLKVDQETNIVLQWDEASQSFKPVREIVFKVEKYEIRELTQY